MPSYDNTPRGVAEIHELLWHELAELHFRWALWLKLYTASADDVALLNQSASEFFARLHQILLEDVILGIARFVDPPTNRHQENLALASLIQALADEKLQQPVQSLVATATAAAHFARNWRNKRLAHRDRAYAQAALDGTSLSVIAEAVDHALKSAADAMNAVEQAFEGRTTFYGDPINVGHERLLAALRDGMLFRRLPQEEQFRLRHGT